MIQLNTCLISFDNSGIRVVRCIRFLNKNKKLGSFLIVSVKSIRSKNIKLKIKKGSILIACLLKKTTTHVKFSGLKLVTTINGVVILNKQFQPISSRIIGVLAREIKLGGLKKISLSGVVI